MRRLFHWAAGLSCCIGLSCGVSRTATQDAAGAAGSGGGAPIAGAPQGGAGSSGGGSGSGGGQGGGGGSAGFRPVAGKTLLLIGQSGRRAHVDFVASTRSLPAGGSVYAELYTGEMLNFEQRAFIEHLARYAPGSYMEVGLAWKDNRVNAGYCDLQVPACAAANGAIAPELDIVAGKYDSALARFAALMKGYPELTFLVRVDYEVSPGMHCAVGDVDACPAYSAAFRHIRERLVLVEGVKNARFVFHPTRGWAKMMYPGADVTDWIGFSVFNHDLCLPTPEGSNAGCKSGDRLDANLAADLAWAVQQDKPLVVAESTVQKPSDDTASGFNEYLSRLFELVEARPQVQALTYINMRWAGHWVYGENWTTGAFGGVDARIGRFTETRDYFCQRLVAGRYVAADGRPLACDSVPGQLPAVPANLDAPASERLVILGLNTCAQVPAATATVAGSAITQGDCATLAKNGAGRFRLDEGVAGAQVWSDVSWLCWSAEGDRVVQRVCSEAPEQRFRVSVVATGAGSRDVTLTASDGRCVSAALGSDLSLSSCSDRTKQQTFRL